MKHDCQPNPIDTDYMVLVHDICLLYTSGENLFTFSPLKSDYIDPEQASAENSIQSANGNAKLYPWSKTYSFGRCV